jgi:hypothetical protein
MNAMRASILVSALLCGVLGFSTGALSAPHFVPNDQAFWDNSANWTTDYGPAYRDTVEQLENMVPCTGQYALCFSSGPEPLPCEIGKDGRFASCTCTAQSGLNFVLISAILNYQVYLDTVAVCRVDGSDCVGQPDKAPVCAAIQSGQFIKGANLISTFSTAAQTAVGDFLTSGAGTACPKGPYAACMTAPCKAKQGSLPVCTCPVFYGVFQLTQTGAQCDLGDELVWSSSFSPLLLKP